jgi:hypothetical protein
MHASFNHLKLIFINTLGIKYSAQNSFLFSMSKWLWPRFLFRNRKRFLANFQITCISKKWYGCKWTWETIQHYKSYSRTWVAQTRRDGQNVLVLSEVWTSEVQSFLGQFHCGMLNWCPVQWSLIVKKDLILYKGYSFWIPIWYLQN